MPNDDCPATNRVQDVGHAESTAATLARRFLLQKEEAAYHVHDVVLDFLQLRLEQDGVAEGLASSRQALYLAKTSVLKEYSDRVQGEYHLVSLWNSIKLDRSVNVADCYDKNLNGITDPDLWRRAGKLLALLVSSFANFCPNVSAIFSFDPLANGVQLSLDRAYIRAQKECSKTL